MNNIRTVIILYYCILIFTMLPAYGQTVNCPNGCTVVVTPGQQSGSQYQQYPSNSISNSLSSSAPTIAGINLGNVTSSIIKQIQNFIVGIEGNSIPQNNYVNGTGVQQATNSGFNVITDIFKTGFDASQFVADLINSFELFHISFWIVALVSMGITIFFIARSGENVLKRILILLVIFAVILGVLWLVKIIFNW